MHDVLLSIFNLDLSTCSPTPSEDLRLQTGKYKLTNIVNCRSLIEIILKSSLKETGSWCKSDKIKVVWEHFLFYIFIFTIVQAVSFWTVFRRWIDFWLRHTEGIVHCV